MEAVFLKLLNMSVTASVLAVVVMLLRLGLKRAPKWVHCLMWAMVALRLILPFTIESAASLMPDNEVIIYDAALPGNLQVHTGLPGVDEHINIQLPQQGTTSSVPAESTVDIMQVLTVLWVAGMAVMAVYSLISYWRLKKQVAPSLALTGNIFLCDYIETPFILGIIRPRIYLPTGMHPSAAAHVLAHERAHIRRLDHWWKPLGFVLLTVHWFNPVIWLAYILLCRDIELACDEKVIKEMGCEDKRSYSEALLRCSVPRRMIAACPLAFGEVGVKERVKNVMRFKKPAFWIILAAVVICVIVAVCFLTDPQKGTPLADFQHYEPESIQYVRLTARFAGEKFDAQEDIDRVIAFLEDAQYDPEPTSQHRSDDRSKIYEIELNYGALSLHFYFDIYFSEMWVNDGETPSLPYRMKDPEAVEEFFSTMLDRKFPPVENADPTEPNSGTDGRTAWVRGTVYGISNRQLTVQTFKNTSFVYYPNYTEGRASYLIVTLPDDYSQDLMVGDTVRVIYTQQDISGSIIDGEVTIELESRIVPMSMREQIQDALDADDATFFSAQENGTQIVVGVQYGEDFALAYFYDYPSGAVFERVVTTDEMESTLLEGVYKEPNSPDSKMAIYLLTQPVYLSHMPVDGEFAGDLSTSVYSAPAVQIRYVSDNFTYQKLVNGEYVTFNYANIRVNYCHQNALIDFILPLTWEYEIRNPETENGSFAIAIRPRGEDGWVSIEYRENSFTPAEAGLQEREMTLSGNNYIAYAGFHEGSEIWSYIRFDAFYQKFIVVNENAAWLTVYNDEAINILRTLQLHCSKP